MTKKGTQTDKRQVQTTPIKDKPPPEPETPRPLEPDNIVFKTGQQPEEKLIIQFERRSSDQKKSK